MLKIISGRALSDRSDEICRRIATCVNEGQKPVLIVPEQFSFESEKAILSLLGDSGAQSVKVLSFSRLCDEVESIYGGSAKGELSESDKIILINAALKNVRDDLKYFGKYSSSSGFAKMMLSTISEFIMNAITSEYIKVAATDLGDGILYRKLHDTVCVYEEYTRLMTEKFPNSVDRMTRLYETLESNRYFDGRDVFIDSFTGFTGQQYRIIERILAQAKDVTVSFCDDVSGNGKTGIFASVKKAKDKIRKLADKYGVKDDGDYIAENKDVTPLGIAAVEEFMCFGKTDKEITENELTVCHAQSIYDEVQFTARNIRRIIREKNARFSDFAVIARNAEDYEQLLNIAFEKNGIRAFCDRRLPLSSFPPAAAVISAMDMVSSITTEKLLRFHKCGVGFLSDEEIFELENYVYIWNINGEKWEKEWNMSPNGIESDRTPADVLFERIKKINEIRVRALEPVEKFRDEFKNSTKSMARAVVTLLESARPRFSEIAEEYKSTENSELSDGIISSYAKIMKILDSLVNCLKADSTAGEFKSAFKNCVEIESVGMIPQMVDEVIFGSAERIQPAKPSYVFILGANQGVFPRAPQASGVFAVSEIGKLIDLGIDIPDCSVNSAIDEDLQVYNCVCCANKGVYISCNQKSGEPSYFLKKLTERFDITPQKEPDALCENNIPETGEDAFSRLCRSEYASVDYETFKSAFADKKEYKSRLSSIYGNITRPSFDIPTELSRELVGNNIRITPSKLEDYNKCPFLYFCRYVLSAGDVNEVGFNSLQTGTLVHHVLEEYIERAGKKLCELEVSQINEMIEGIVKEYLDSFKGYREMETPHLKLKTRILTENLKYVAVRIKEEFAQSDFVPEKCELYIGGDDSIPAIRLPVDGETSISVTGSVDRIDRYGDFVRVIDYKTGGKAFELPDILSGQNMQMLIYLYAVCKNGKFGKRPAGIFYMQASLPYGNEAKDRRMDGFMPEDDNLIFAMDKSGEGEYIEQSNKKKYKPQNVTEESFDKIFDFIELKLKQTGKNIADGHFSAAPVDGISGDVCKYCLYSSVCRIEEEKHQCVQQMNAEEVLEEIERQVSEDGISAD